MVKVKIADNLRQLMNETATNQVVLSKAINISQSAISTWLSGKKEPSITSLWLLADYFNCSVDELIGRTNM